MPDVRFFPFVDGITRSQSAVAPNKHHTVGSMGGTVRWDTYVPSGVKGLRVYQLIICCYPLDRKCPQLFFHAQKSNDKVTKVK